MGASGASADTGAKLPDGQSMETCTLLTAFLRRDKADGCFIMGAEFDDACVTPLLPAGASPPLPLSVHMPSWRPAPGCLTGLSRFGENRQKLCWQEH